MISYDDKWHAARYTEDVALTCDLCQLKFWRQKGETRKPNFRLRKFHFCSKECKARYATKQDTVNCANCNSFIMKPLSVIRRSKTGNLFCCKSCAAQYNNSKRLHTVESLRKSSLIGKKVSQTGQWKINLFTERALSYRQKIHGERNCSVCSQPFVFNSKTQKRITCGSPGCLSEHRSLHNFRQNKTWGKCGRFCGIWCASSWELAFVAYQKLMNLDVKRFNGNFQYQYHGRTRRYFPDFEIDGVIYEVKGRMTDDVQLKIDSVRQTGRQILLLTKAQIAPMIKFVQVHYNIKDITSLYDK